MKHFLFLFLLLATAARSATFRNPVINADVPDMDVIRVGADYYLMSTTMHLMPAAPVMHSRDLVSWQPISYLLPSMHDTPRYDMQGGTVYGRGQWATSLRYARGRFWALFSPNDEPYRSYLMTADRAEGPWRIHARMKHFHDCSLFFDDNRAYVFYGTGQMAELNDSLTDVKPGSERRLFQRDSDETGLLEGSRVIKHAGKYYLLMISWPRGEKRRQVCYRADSVAGPYEKHVILCSDFDGYPPIGQGTIVDTPDGQWYALIFQDRGAIGRVPCLLPCTWQDGWPILGDQQGRVPLVAESAPRAQTPFVVSDDFAATALDLHWQWNHNPVDTAWSLAARPGWLRLATSRTAPNLYLAPNTLTQRMEGPACTAVVRLDVSHMRDGDRAGLAAFNGESALLAVRQDGDKRTLVMEDNSVALDDKTKAVISVKVDQRQQVDITGHDIVYLELHAEFAHRDLATFRYSLDGSTWTAIGQPSRMVFDYRRFFMGTKFAIFNYATTTLGGYVDVDYFNYNRF